MSDLLEVKRKEIAERLAALKVAPEVAEIIRQADEAVGEFKAEAARLESQLDVIDAQVGVRETDRRAVAARERQNRLAALRCQLVDEEQARLQAVAEAEAATRGLVDALNRTLASNARMATLAQGLSANGKVPGALNPYDLVSRLSGRISGLMETVAGHRGRFGGLQWVGGSLYPPDRSWRDDEEKAMAAQLMQPLLKEKRNG